MIFNKLLMLEGGFVIMIFVKLKEEYENRISKINKWNNLKKTKYEKNLKYLTIFIGVILLMSIIFYNIKFKNDSIKQIICNVLIILFLIIYILSVNWYLKKMHNSSINSKKIINDFDVERLKSLKRILIKESICFDNVEKIQLIIEELNYMKYQVFPVHDIIRFIINPLVIIGIPFLTIFLENLIQHENIWIQAQFLSLILHIIAMILMMFYMFLAPIRWLLYRKYDNLIYDLKLLQLINNCE